MLATSHTNGGYVLVALRPIADMPSTTSEDDGYDVYRNSAVKMLLAALLSRGPRRRATIRITDGSVAELIDTDEDLLAGLSR